MKHTQPANIAYSGISFIIETEMIASPMNGKGNRNLLRFSSLLGGRFDIDAMIDDDPPRKEHSVISIRVCIPQSLSDSMIGMLSILPKYV